MMTPTVSSEAVDSVYALIRLISSPDEAKAALVEMTQLAHELRARKEEAAGERKAADAAKAEMDRTAESIRQQNDGTLRQVKEERSLALEALAKAQRVQAEVDRALAEMRERDNAFIATSEQTRKELETAATGVTEREARVAEREKNLAEAEMKANDLVREYQEKLAKLQSLIA